MEIIYDAVQSITANGDVLFNTTVVSSKCRAIYHRAGSGLVKLKGLTQGTCFARFKVTFGGNIALPTGATAAPISLAVAIDGEIVPATTMISTPGDAAAYNNISTSTYVDVPAGCCSTVTIENTSGVAIDVQNANLIVERVA